MSDSLHERQRASLNQPPGSSRQHAERHATHDVQHQAGSSTPYLSQGPHDKRRPNLPTSIVAAYSQSQPQPQSATTRSRTGSFVLDGWLRPVAGPTRHSIPQIHSHSRSHSASHRETGQPTNPTSSHNPQLSDMQLSPLHLKYDPSANRTGRQSPVESTSNQSSLRPSSAGQHHQHLNPAQHQQHLPRRQSVPSAPQDPLDTITTAHPNLNQTASPVPVHPAVSKVTAAALTPIQKLYEHAWFKTVSNVQFEVGRLHTELSASLDAERGRRGQAEGVVEELRRENAGLRQECGALKLRLGKMMREREEGRYKEGRVEREGGGREDMDKVLEDMEEKAREERALRALAEGKLMDAMDKLRAITEGIFPSSVNDRPSSSSSVSATQPKTQPDRERLYSDPATLVGSPDSDVRIAELHRNDEHDHDHSVKTHGNHVSVSSTSTLTSQHGDSQSQPVNGRPTSAGKGRFFDGRESMSVIVNANSPAPLSPPVLANPFHPSRNLDQHRLDKHDINAGHRDDDRGERPLNHAQNNKESGTQRMSSRVPSPNIEVIELRQMPSSPVYPRAPASPESERERERRAERHHRTTSLSSSLYPVTPVSPDHERERDREMERRRHYAGASLRLGSSPSGSTRPPSSSGPHSHIHNRDNSHDRVPDSAPVHNHTREQHRPVLPPLSDLYKPPYNTSRPASRRSRTDNSRGDSISPMEATIGAGCNAAAGMSKEVYCASPVDVDVNLQRPSRPASASGSASRSAVPRHVSQGRRVSPPQAGRPVSPPQAGHHVSSPPQSMHRAPSLQGGFHMTSPPRPSRRNGNEGVYERCLLKKRDRSEFERESGGVDAGGDGCNNRNLKRRLSSSGSAPIGVDGNDDGDVKAEEDEDEPVWPKLRPVRDFEDLNQDCDSSSGSSIQADPLPLPLPLPTALNGEHELEQSQSRKMSHHSGTSTPPLSMMSTQRSVERAPLKSTSTNIRVRIPVRNKLGINHMDLLYETRQDKMVCRMCWSETKDASAAQDPETTPNPIAPKKFPAKATWAELIGHCQEAHSKSCEDLEKLSPSQVAELRQRMTSSKSPGFMLK